MNLTFLLQGETPDVQIGYHNAFQNLRKDGVLAGYRAFPYRAVAGRDGWRKLFSQVVWHMRESGSDGLFLQNFHGPLPDPRQFLEKVRQLPQRPVIATSCGDPFGPRLNPPPESLLAAATAADLTFCTSMGRLATALAKAGARRITLMPHSACHVRFGTHYPPSRAPEFDVVFIGSSTRARNPLRQYYWSDKRRRYFVEWLDRRYGTRFGLFGHGWQGLRSWQGPIAFHQQVATSRLGRVLFGGYPGSWCDYYASDRPFIGLLSGVPMVDIAVPRVDRLLQPGEEWFLASDVHGIIRNIDYLLDSEDQRQRAGSQGAAAIRARHMSTHRAQSISQIMDQVGSALRRGDMPSIPILDFFHEGVDPNAEAATALVRW